MAPVRSTYEILALKVLNRSVGKKWTDWATEMLQIKNTIVILILFASKFAFGQNEINPFLKLTADSVVFYDFGGRPEEEILSIIEKNGSLSKTVIKSTKLDKLSADNFTKLLGQKASYGGSTASCFEPHLGVVYYSSNSG